MRPSLISVAWQSVLKHFVTCQDELMNCLNFRKFFPLTSGTAFSGIIGKEDNLLKISVPFHFPPRIFRIKKNIGWWVRISIIERGNFCTIWHDFETRTARKVGFTVYLILIKTLTHVKCVSNMSCLCLYVWSLTKERANVILTWLTSKEESIILIDCWIIIPLKELLTLKIYSMERFLLLSLKLAFYSKESSTLEIVMFLICSSMLLNYFPGLSIMFMIFVVSG